jgi:acyl carrier protein
VTAASAEQIAGTVLRVSEEVLERSEISLEDDFFDVGGDSITAMHLIGRLRNELDVPLRVRMLFEQPTFGALVERITALREGSAATDIGPAEDPRATVRAIFDDPDRDDERSAP